MSATEVASAYLALYTKMPGVKKDIEDSLGGSEAQSAVDKSGKSLGGKLLGGISSVVKVGALAVGATIATGIGASLVKGFGRLQAIDTADKKLTGLGQSAESVDAIMQNALAAVRGTAFGLGDAGTVAAQVVAAGIKPGVQLEGVLKSVANSAAAAGTDLGSMGSIYAAVAASGRAYNDTLGQLSERGIPIYQALAKQLGVSTDQVRELASAGQIGFEQFQSAAAEAAGTVALELGKTLPGASANLMASLGRIGAGLMGGIFPYLAPLVSAITSALAPLEGKAAELGAKLAELIGPGLQWLTDALNGGIDVSGFLDILSVLSPLGLAFQVLAPVLPLLMEHFMALGQVIGGALSSVFQSLMPVVLTLAKVFSGVLAAVLPKLLPVIQQLAGMFGQVLVAVAPLVGQLVSALLPAFTLISPIIAALMPIFSQLIGLLMPIIQAILPVLTMLIQTLASIFTQLVAAVMPLLTPILALLSPLLDLVGMILPPLIELIGWLIGVAIVPLQLAMDALIPIITGVVNALSTYLVPIIDTIMGVLGGLITFLTGVFTGNWEMAWKGVQDIFSAIWDGVQNIAKGAINAIIDLINGVIGGINGMTGALSDATGGAINLQIGEIPRLADGAVVSRRPGGIIANIGEGRYDEAVLPLSPAVLSQLGGGGGPRVQVDVHGGPGMDAETVGTIAGDRVAFALRGA